MDTKFIVFTLDKQPYALRYDAVIRVVRAVEITAVPHAPVHISGVINVKGDIIPVINFRTYLALPGRSMKLTDHIIVGQTSSANRFALVVDNVEGIENFREEDIERTKSILSESSDMQAVIKKEEGMILIQDPDVFQNLLSQIKE